VLSAIALSLVLQAAVGTASPADTPAQYYWRWSDGGSATHRTLREPTIGRAPALIVTASPAVRGRPVELQVRWAGGWRTEDAGRTDSRGRVVLELNPYCENGAWCESAYDYRLRVEGRTASLHIRFTSAGGTS
jgi:hypothetical protein